MTTYREELKYLKNSLADLEKALKDKNLLDTEMDSENDEMLEEAYDRITTVCSYGI